MSEQQDGSAGGMVVQVYRDKAGEYRWRLVAGNNRVVADSGEGYYSREDALRAVRLVRANLAVATIEADR